MAGILKRIGIVVFWLLVWQLVSVLVGNPVLLCGPADVVVALAGDVITSAFWLAIGGSLVRIVAGLAAAFACGLVFGAFAWRSPFFGDVLDPAIRFLKSVPIVCFIVLLLIWFGSTYVSAIAVFLVAFPAFYFATIEGLQARDGKMLELLQVFGVSRMRRVAALYVPTLTPFLTATGRVAVGMGWKAGVAAELIGLPFGSIGTNIYQAKITLSSADLLAWTAVIVLLSLICERVFLWLLKRSGDWSWNAALPRYQAPATGLSPEAPTGEASGNRERGTVPFSRLGSLVSLEGVTKYFDGRAVVDDLSAEIGPGERWGLSSPSGSGKTSLLLMAAGLLAPDAGSVKSNARLGMVFQETRLFENQSALDNIRLVAGHHCSLVAIEGLLQELLPGQDFMKPVAQFSGGQRRRIEVVRALAAASQLVLLDEPFTGLDEANKVIVQTFILQHLDGRALIIASHDRQDFDALEVGRLLF